MERLLLEYLVVALGIGYDVYQMANIDTWKSALIPGACIPILWWLYHLEVGFSLQFKQLQTLIRPSGSPGIWCTVLVPLSLFLGCHVNKYNCSVAHRMSSLASVPLLFLALLWLYSNRNKGTTCLNDKSGFIVQHLIPTTTCVLLFYFYSDVSLLNGIAASVILNGTFQFCLPNLLTLSPKSFTFGEAVIVSHGVSVFCMSAYLNVQHHLLNSSGVDQLEGITLICQVAILGTCFFVFLLIKQPFSRSAVMFYIIAIGIAVFFIIPVLYVVLNGDPFLWFFDLIWKEKTRVLLMFYWSMATAIAILVVSKDRSVGLKMKTVVRKYFHILMIVTYLPGMLYDNNLLYMASVITLGIFIILECFRILNIPPFGGPINSAFLAFLDEKDQGRLILTHVYLLIGCSLPIWLIPELTTRVPLAVISGILAIGFGDTMASVGGTWIGKHRWPGINKTVEGTAFSIITQVVVCQLLSLTDVMYVPFWPHLVGICLSSLLEAFTIQIDNLILPLYLYILFIV